MPQFKQQNLARHQILDLVDAVAPGQKVQEIVETGTSSVIVLTQDLAIRIARDEITAQELKRTQRLVDELPEFSFQIPRSAADILDEGDIVAVPTVRLTGSPHAPGSGDPRALKTVLDEIQGVETSGLKSYLAEPHVFCGGRQWLDVLEEIVPLLDAGAQDPALEIIHQLKSQESKLTSADLGFTHGDLAGSNMLFAGEQVTSVLDWDLASLSDPADDVASLANWHGWQLLPQLASPQLAGRAEILRQSHPLQAVAFAYVHGRPEEELMAEARRASERIIKNSSVA
ncbi:aminoglycoside phosphotransferase family protein [Rothia sp. LK2492]|uniref:aminoglycoside phosphotransferase family protein n=1 Tax=Rothia sp. LK2492 TaxID=3114370 RepID=UPI0034CECB52